MLNSVALLILSTRVDFIFFLLRLWNSLSFHSTSDFDMYQLCDFRQISLNYFPCSNFLICKIGIRRTCFIRYLQGYHKTMSNLQFQLNKNIKYYWFLYFEKKLVLFIIHRQWGTNKKTYAGNVKYLSLSSLRK